MDLKGERAMLGEGKRGEKGQERQADRRRAQNYLGMQMPGPLHSFPIDVLICIMCRPGISREVNDQTVHGADGLVAGDRQTGKR